MVKDRLIENIKLLQDLKFEIYSRSSNLDFHSFDIYKIIINNDEVIDLSDWISNYKEKNSLPEIAEMIVQEYGL
ncbi:hypothetical protein RD055328_01480 [Companilactobacillus sp. RD055328]|uniref:hypothetical protein n=1 Tax=Companilactobacillus sp. RD055328 TaxID=2916634 RepID=UPI001FC8572B|nr:hypothetical protein [Companilactobacillus sp. RD055328]GKQ42225.1 hypothetical protein RD055328_01480 [Companilactobacillus sp. RD055328]